MDAPSSDGLEIVSNTTSARPTSRPPRDLSRQPSASASARGGSREASQAYEAASKLPDVIELSDGSGSEEEAVRGGEDSDEDIVVVQGPSKPAHRSVNLATSRPCDC